MKKLFVRLTILTASLLIGSSMFAQNPSDLTDTLNKLLGGNKDFSSKLEIKANVPNQGEITIPLQLSYSENKVRAEIDLALINPASIPSEVKGYLDMMKKADLAKIVAIFRADKNLAYVISPGLKSYAEQTVPQNSTPDASKIKIDTTELGKETVDNHPTVKNKVVVTSDGTPQEFTVWNATDLKNFPVKIEATVQGQTVTVSFKDVKLTKPDAQQFEAPKDLTKHDSVQGLVEAGLAKIGQTQ